MNRKASIRLMIAVIGAAPLALLAAEPATQPISDSNTPPQVSPIAPGINDDAQGRRGGGQRGGMMALSDKERADAMKFMQENSLERFNYLENLPQGTPQQSQRKERLKNVAALAALQVMRLQREDQHLYEISVRRIKLEDEVFALDAIYHKAPADKQDDFREQLKKKVAELVDVGIEERKWRLTKLQNTVNAEQKQLADDEGNKAKLVDERVTAILNASGGLGASFKPAGPGGGNGGNGPHRGQRQPGDGTPP